jgi:hypothetical protein
MGPVDRWLRERPPAKVWLTYVCRPWWMVSVLSRVSPRPRRSGRTDQCQSLLPLRRPVGLRRSGRSRHRRQVRELPHRRRIVHLPPERPGDDLPFLLAPSGRERVEFVGQRNGQFQGDLTSLLRRSNRHGPPTFPPAFSVPTARINYLLETSRTGSSVLDWPARTRRPRPPTPNRRPPCRSSPR